MTIGVSEVARVAAPESLLRRLENLGASLLRAFERSIDLGFRADVEGQRDAAEARALRRDLSILGQQVAWIQGQDNSPGVKENDVVVIGGARCLEA